MKIRKLLFNLATLLVFASLLAACGGGATTTEAPPATEAPATEAPATEAPTEAPTEAATEAPNPDEGCREPQFDKWYNYRLYPGGFKF